MLKSAIYDYAKLAIAKQQQETPMRTADDLLQERVSKSRDEQKMYSDLIKTYQRQHPGCSQSNAIDAVLFSPQVKKRSSLNRGWMN
jgi:hypothetical protein